MAKTERERRVISSKSSHAFNRRPNMGADSRSQIPNWHDGQVSNITGDYAKGDLEIWLELRVPWDTENWNACLKSADQLGSCIKFLTDGEYSIKTNKRLDGANKLNVFVCSVDFVEGVEKIVPSLVWLGVDDPLSSARRDIWNLAVQKAEEVLGVIPDRKASVSGGDAPILSRQRTGEIFQGRPGVLANVAELQPDRIWHRVAPDDLDDFVGIGSVKIRTSLKGDIYLFPETVCGGLQLINFEFRPSEPKVGVPKQTAGYVWRKIS